ncbi:response regulator [Roseicella sp. DB1501]|uniref:response regulator n=1 Tax=Roseicella sp. DB1501 TaxID=2730925 RepID=UPI00149190A6|nr:response regulator [Roseicella sp. DB1501]NOG68887.1 response regulator [Roseicella sp. DB1501]
MGSHGDGIRVLLAEDEPLAALVVGEALAEMGHDVMHAEDGAAALDIAATCPFDLLVTDLAMPRVSGLELIPRLRAEQPGLPVLVMTGYLPPAGARLLAEAGPAATALLLKPFDLRQLTAALARITPPVLSGGSGRPAPAAMPC